ncbi:hypothetical protein ABIF57_003079 [Bradyrhizobium diazoefficiens]
MSPRCTAGRASPPFEPCGNRFELGEFDEITGAVEADEVAHPAKHRDVGDGVVVIHEPLPAGQMRLHHAEQTPGLAHVAFERPLVLEILAGEFVEETDLAEHRPDPAHLEMHPLDGLVAARGILRQQLAGLLREILQNRPGLEQRQRPAAGTVGIEDRRDLAVRIERQKLGRLLVVLAEIDKMDLVGKPDLLQHDRHLDAVRRRQRIELKQLRMPCRPALGDGKGGEIGHRDPGIVREIVA